LCQLRDFIPQAPFLAGFYSRDLILEMVSFSYVNLIGFMLFIVSTGLTVCYSFRLFYYVFFGDFNSSTLCLIVDDSFNMVCGMIGLMLFAVFGGRILRLIIFCTPSMICLPGYLRFLVTFVSLLGG
jgi:NADH-ubiquinone oxidoreductase chain 5